MIYRIVTTPDPLESSQGQLRPKSFLESLSEHLFGLPPGLRPTAAPAHHHGDVVCFRGGVDCFIYCLSSALLQETILASHLTPVKRPPRSVVMLRCLVCADVDAFFVSLRPALIVLGASPGAPQRLSLHERPTWRVKGAR